MFEHVTLHGTAATIVWHYHTAAVLGAWRIAKTRGGKWTLVATLTRADTFQLRQRPLLFTAPRAQGFWAWGVESLDVGPRSLRAILGPPEQ